MSAYEAERPYEIRKRAHLVDVPGTGRDISKYVTRIDKFTHVGTGEIPSIQLMLNSTHGQFLTQSSAGIAGEDTPIIDQYDEIEVKMIDDYEPTRTFSRIMYLDDKLPQQNSSGQLYPIELFGREAYLKKVKITGWFWFITYADMIETIFKYYNSKRGERQPGIYFENETVTGLPKLYSTRPDAHVVAPFLAGTFDFHTGVNCYDALMQVIGRLNNPVALGGAGKFHEMVFTDDPDNGDRIVCTISPIANVSDADVVTTVLGRHVDTQSVTETHQPVAANLVVVKGQADTGRYPTEIATFTSRLEEYHNYPIYDPTVEYDVNSYVRWHPSFERRFSFKEYTLYRKLITSAAGTDPTLLGNYWVIVSKLNYLQKGSDHTAPITLSALSPWTKGKAVLVKAYGSGAYNNGALDNSFDSTAFPDSNLVVKDGDNYRNWADCRIKNMDDIPDHLRYRANVHPVTEAQYAATLPEDMRCLIDQSLPQAFKADSYFYNTTTNTWKSDQFGVSYYDALVQWRNGKWIVVREPHKTMEIAVLDEPNVYVYLRDFASTPQQTFRSRLAADQHSRTKIGQATAGRQNYRWRSVQTGNTGAWLGLDCFHYPFRIDNAPSDAAVCPTGLINSQDAKALGVNSGVEIEFVWGPLTYDASHTEGILTDIIKYLRNHAGFVGEFLANNLTNIAYFLTQRGAYNFGWWTVLFKAPSPQWGAGNDKSVGAVFGGDINNKVSVLDLNNLNYTHDGKTGWDADSAAELGPITGIHFMFNFDIRAGQDAVGTTRLPGATGNQVFRCTIYDTEDNVWIQDFTYRFLGDTQQIILPISGFKIYRARNPLATTLSDSIKNIITPELKVLEIFEKRKVKMITLQWQESYDEAGRYAPWTISRWLVTLGANLLWGTNLRTRGIVDAFGFVKAPFAIAKKEGTNVGDIGAHHLMEDIPEYPGVSNVEQLKKIAQAELDLAQFRKDNFTIRTTGKCDLKPGDVIWFQDIDMINRSQNRKKLLVKKINYTVNAVESATEGGTPGGFVRYITVKDVINL